MTGITASLKVKKILILKNRKDCKSLKILNKMEKISLTTQALLDFRTELARVLLLILKLEQQKAQMKEI